MRPLIITVDINGYLLLGTLVDIGASRSACSITTLDYLDIKEEEITRQSVLCQGYDNNRTEALETVQLAVTIGPLTSITTVMVMEHDLSEPLILGRSWLAEI